MFLSTVPPTPRLLHALFVLPPPYPMAIGMGGLGTLPSMSGLGPDLELCPVEVEQATLGDLPHALGLLPLLE